MLILFPVTVLNYFITDSLGISKNGNLQLETGIFGVIVFNFPIMMPLSIGLTLPKHRTVLNSSDSVGILALYLT